MSTRRFRSPLKALLITGCRYLAGKQRRSDGAILLYHSVGPDGVPTSRFRRQMDHLIKRFEVNGLRAATEGTASRRGASVTFDDGRLDDYQAAMMALEPLGIRATFYLIPPMLGKSLSTSRGEIRL